MSRINLYLFDLDNTLVNVNDIHKKAFEDMMREVFGHGGSFEASKGPGRTTSIILHEMLSHLSDEEVEEKMEIAEERLAKTLIEDVEERHVLPRIKELLARLSENHKIGLYTGGAGPVTTAILRNTGLDKFFDVAVSAEGDEDRAVYLGKAIEQSTAKHGDFEKIFVVGDTLHDIWAAKEHNAFAVSVGTGVHPNEELKAEKPDYFFENLEDVDKVMEEIG